MSMPEKMSTERLREGLGGTPIELCVLGSIDSTNAEARRAVLRGACLPTAFLAETQTAGRGRMSRSFYSPSDTGIYCTLLLPMRDVQADTVSLTAVAAVAVRRAILRVIGVSTAIKWVNDLYLGERKVCGILAETVVRGEERFLILGVGINLCTREFPEELSSIAGSLLSEGNGMRNRLAATLISELYDALLQPNDSSWLGEYRACSNILGRQIRYTEQGKDAFGVAESIDEKGRLVVRREDGGIDVLASGEISVRLNELKKEGEIK